MKTFEEFQALFNEDLNTWTLKQNSKEASFLKNGYRSTVRQRKNPPFAVDLVRADYVFKNADLQKFYNYFDKASGNAIKECTELEVLPNGDKIVYIRLRVPMMTDRDSAQYQHIEKVNGGLFISSQTVDWPACPPKPGIVRMNMTLYFYIRPDEHDASLTHLTQFLHHDLKGNIPTRLLNMIIAGEVVKEAKAINAVLKI